MARGGRFWAAAVAAGALSLASAAGAHATAPAGTTPAPASATDAPPATVVPAARGLVGSVRPERLYDSRTDAPLGPRENRVVCDTLASIPNGAAAMVLNLTVVAPTSAGFLTAWPGFEDTAPVVSNLNFGPGTVTSNLAVVPMGPVGCITLHNGSRGTVHVVVDVQGYLTDGPATAPATTQTVYPSRILDTRTRRVAVPARGSLEVQVAGRGGLPATNVGAAWLNLTVTGNAAAGFLTAYPTGTTRPPTSNLNFGAAETRAALTLAKTGTSGRVTVYNGSAKPVHLVVDASGFVRGGDGRQTLAGVTSIVPTRVLDTRRHVDLAPGGSVPLPSDSVTAPTNASTMVVAVTAVNATGSGYLVVEDGYLGHSGTSVLNFTPGRATTNLVLARSGQKVVVRNGSSRSAVDVVVDVTGWVNPERAASGAVVRSDDGSPLGGMAVTSSEGGAEAVFATTRSDGTYSGALPPQMSHVKLCSGAGAVGFAGGCYPSWDAPKTFDLAIGEQVTGAIIPRGPTEKLTGTAVDHNGVKLTGGLVYLRRASDDRTYSTSVSAAGEFASRVPAGDYYVYLSQPLSTTSTRFGLSSEWDADLSGYELTPTRDLVSGGASPVHVVAGEPVDVSLHAEPEGRVRGKLLVTAGGQPATGSAVRVYRVDGVALPWIVSVESDGTWAVDLHPGKYIFCTRLGLIDRCWKDNVDRAHATPAEVVAEQELTGIDLTLR